MSRIRIIATYEAATTFYRDLPPFLVANGHEVTILMTTTEYRGGRERLEDALDESGVILDLIKGPAAATTRAGKLVAMVRFFGGAIWRTLTGPGVDVNVFFSTPPLFAAWGLVLRVLRRQRFACLVQDVWPDVLHPDEPVPGVVLRLLRWVGRFTWRRADGVLVIGRCMRDVVLAAGVEPSRIHVVGNWAPTATIDHDGSSKPLRVGLGIAETDLLVMYAGNLGLAHTFSEVLAVVERLEADEVPVHFLFVGEGSRKASLLQAVHDNGLRKVSFMGFQPMTDLPATLATADVHLVTMRRGYEGLVVPSKTFAPWAVGRAVLYVGAPSGEIARIIEEERVGAVIDNEDVDSLEAVLRSWAADRTSVAEAGVRAHAISRGSGRVAPLTVMLQYDAALRAVVDGDSPIATEVR